jgi:hypothetical protein
LRFPRGSTIQEGSSIQEMERGTVDETALSRAGQSRESWNFTANFSGVRQKSMGIEKIYPLCWTDLSSSA